MLSAPLWGLIFWYKAWRRYVCERYKLLPHSVKFLYFKCWEVVGYQILFFMAHFSVISSNNLWYLVYHWKKTILLQHSLFLFFFSSLTSANFKKKNFKDELLSYNYPNLYSKCLQDSMILSFMINMESVLLQFMIEGILLLFIWFSIWERLWTGQRDTSLNK